MITKKDAIAIGTAICAAVTRDCASVGNGQYTAEARYSARGTGCYAIDNLWYDVLSSKVREQFPDSCGYPDKNAFYKACGWPE